jgi:hypothetical protein
MRCACHGYQEHGRRASPGTVIVVEHARRCEGCGQRPVVIHLNSQDRVLLLEMLSSMPPEAWRGGSSKQLPHAARLLAPEVKCPRCGGDPCSSE